MKMKLSCFGRLSDLEAIERAGYDCAELQVREIVELSEDEFKAAVRKVKSLDITCEVFDNPIPLDVRIPVPEFDLKYWTEYLKIGAYRTAELGARYYVFGNGRSRSLPVEGDVQSAYNKLMEFLNILCDVTAEYNITVLLEPLAPSLSNFINSIPEAVEFIEKFGKYNLKTMCDFRWLVASGRPIDDIVNYEKYVKHIHIDNPLTEFPKRLMPSLDDGYDYSPLIEALKKICYKEIIAIEANTFDNFEEDIKKGLEFFRQFGIYPYRS
ncbi:MAG: sugar phosphate isomerase/epimerase [Synergistetes bacterium]|nr:sugar phosphate isomerase/epimerase [Synergistota bacterium]MDK2870871.1 hypothetical protein [bacterium]